MENSSTNWIDYLISLSPVLQTAIWACVAILFAWVIKEPIRHLAERLVERVGQGDKIITPYFSIERQEQLNQLDYIQTVSRGEDASTIIRTENSEKSPTSSQEFEAYRQSIYDKNRNIFLAHVITPSENKSNNYNIYIFLVRHKQMTFTDVSSADFYFGKMWHSRIFRETPKNGLIGLRMSAYGTFLCVCRINFSDGNSAMISRYIDFEMGAVEVKS